jgi:hypothetical protein
METRNMDADDSEKIVKAIHGLRNGDPLREQAELILADQNAAIEDLQPILRKFGKRLVFRRREQIVASWLIGYANWTNDQKETISANLSRLLDAWTSAREPLLDALRWFGRGVFMFAWLFGVLSSASVYSAGLTLHWEWDKLFLIIVLLVIFAPMCCLAWIGYCRLRKTRSMIEALGDLSQPASISSIATAATYDGLRDTAAIALRKVTSKLRTEHYGSLPTQTVPALCQALKFADRDNVLVILKALSFIGDGRSIKTVERFAKRPPTDEIGKAASELLPILKQRDIESKAPSQLLRASECAADVEHELLRGVTRGKECDSELLVRAAGVEHE